MDIPTVTTQEAQSFLQYLPSELAGYVVLAIIIAWGMRKIYKEVQQDKDKILSTYEKRLATVENDVELLRSKLEDRTEALTAAQISLVKVQSQLDAAREEEARYKARLERLEDQYEAQIKTLKEEIHVLRVRLGEVSESEGAEWK